jgi:hypothetical protein
MELIAEILVNLAFLLIIFIIRWSRQHKEATVTILLFCLAFIDLLFILRYFGKF